MATRSTTHVLKNSDIVNRPLPSVLIKGEPIVNTADGIVFFSGFTTSTSEWTAAGTGSTANFFEVGSNLYDLRLRNQIIEYQGQNGGALVGKFLSGTTSGFVLGNISEIQGVTTRVQPGVNIYTGGTADNPTVNLTASPSIDNLTFSGTATGGNVFATNVSGGTIYSGSTNLYDIFVDSVNAGSNTTIGGTASNPIVNLVASPSFNNITYSGVSTGGSSIATNVSATTAFYSAGTSLETIIYNIANSTESITSVQPGTNITTGGTATNPIINLTASPSVNNLTFSGTATGGNIFATNVSGGTIYSGSTNLYDIFVDSVNAGSNITIGGTASNPIVNVSSSPTFSGLVSATGFTDSSLTQGRVVYVGTSGRLVDESGFEYNDSTNLLTVGNINVTNASGTTATIGQGGLVIGSGGSISTPGIGNLVVHGDLTVFGTATTVATSELYVEDPQITLNYNPTGSSIVTSVASGIRIQDGSGLVASSAVTNTDVYLTVAQMNTFTGGDASEYTGSTGYVNRAFLTQLNDIVIRNTNFNNGAPDGVRVLAEFDVLDGGTY